MKSKYNINKFKKIYNNKVLTKFGINKAIEQNDNEDILKEDIPFRYHLDNDFKRNFIDINNNMSMIFSNKNIETPSRFVRNEGVANEMERLIPFYDELTTANLLGSKKATGSSLMHKTIKIDSMNTSRTNAKINTSKKEMMNLFKKVKDAKEVHIFDLETLSGRDISGNQIVDSIQEIAMDRYVKDSSGKMVLDEKGRIETLIGISREQANSYRKDIISNFDKDGFGGSEKSKVIAERLAKIGHKDTKIEYRENGIAVIKNFASDDSKDLMNPSNIENGIKILEDLYNTQDIQRTASGLRTHEEMLFEVAHRLNTQMSIGYNSIKFDTNVLNRELAKTWKQMSNGQKEYITKKYNFDSTSIPVIDTTGKQLDMFDFVKMNADLHGKAELHSLTNLEKLNNLGLSTLRQESLGHEFASNSMSNGSHAAINDIDVLSQLAFGESKYGMPLLDHLHDNIKNSEIKDTDIKAGSLLIANNPSNYSDLSRSGALGFTHDPYTDTIRTFNGYEIGKNGVKDVGQYGKASGYKNGVMYQIDNMMQMDMNEEWIDIANSVSPENAHGRMYMLKMSPVLDKNIAKDNKILSAPKTMLFDSYEQMQGFVSSGFAHVGEMVDNVPTPLIENMEDIASNFGITTLAENGNVVSSFDINDAITLGTNKLINDSASRFVSNMEYNKIAKFNALQDYLIDNGASSVDQQIAMLQSITDRQSPRFNQELESKIRNIIGFTSKESSDPQLYTSTLNNYIGSYKYLSSIRPVTDEAINFANDFGAKTPYEKQMAFKTVVDNAIDMANEVGVNPEESIKSFNIDTNYAEFNLPDGYFKSRSKNAMKDSIDSTIKINLNKKNEFSLVDTLLKRSRDDERIMSNPKARNVYGKEEVTRLIKTINSSEEYKHEFDYLVGDELAPAYADISADTLAEMFINDIKKTKDKNPDKFKLSHKTYTNVTKEYINSNVLNEDIIQQAKDLAEKTLPKMSIVSNDKESLEMNAQKFVDEYLMPKIKLGNGKISSDIDEIVEFAQNTYGYNKQTASILKATLEEHRAMHFSGAKKIIKSVNAAGGAILYNGNENELSFMFGDKMISGFDVPRTEMKNGVLYHRIGTQRFSAGTKYSKKENKIVSNLEDYYDGLKYTESSIDRAIKKGHDPVGVFQKHFSVAKQKAREISTLNRNTTKDIQSWNKFDESEIIDQIPDMIDKIKAYEEWQDPNFVDILKNNIESIKKGIISSEVQEAIVKNKGDLLKIAIGTGAGNKLKNKNNSEIFINGIGTYGKKGVILGEYEPVALLGWDNHARPPAASADNIQYKKDKLEKIFSQNELKGRVEAGSRLQSEFQSRGLHFDDAGEVVDHITVKNASISEHNFKNVIAEHFEKKLNDKNLTNAEREKLLKIKEAMSSLNLAEQGKIVDGYLSKELLAKTEARRISTFKDFQESLEINSRVMNNRIKNVLPVIQIAENGAIEFELGELEHVKRGEDLFNFNKFGGGISSTAVKEKSGFLSFKYYAKDTNIEMSKDEISKYLNDNKDLVSSPIDAMKLLDKKYDSAFVIENSFIKGYNKGTSELAEKGMYTSLLSGAGTIDSDVKKALETMGLEDSYGEILGEDYIEKVVKPKYAQLSKTDKDNIGIKTWNSFKDKIKKEQMAMSDELREIEAFDGVTTISVDNVKKHRNLGFSIKHFIHDIAETYEVNQNLEKDEAYKKTYDLLKDKEVFNQVDMRFENGRIVFSNTNQDDTYLNENKVKEIYDEFNMKNKDIITHDGEVVGRKTTASLSFNLDYSGSSTSSNEIESIKNELQNISTEINNRKAEGKNIEHLLDRKKSLSSRLIGLDEIDKTMKISTRELNMLGLRRYTNDNMDKVRKKLDDESYNKVFGHLLDGDNRLKDSVVGKKVNSYFINDIEKQAIEEGMKNREAINGNILAMSFNSNDVSKEYLEKEHNFDVMHIDDVVTSHGEDTIFLKNNKHGTHNKNIIIETGLEGEQSHVAISSMDSKISGTSVTNDDVQKQLKKVVDNRTRYLNAINGDNSVITDGSTLDNIKAGYINSIEELKNVQEQKTKDNIKELGEVRIKKYSYDKADLANIHLDDIENNKFTLNKSYHMYDKSMINGKSVGQWAAEDVHYNASWHGLDYFENLGYFNNDTLKKYNMTKDEMISHLEKSGTASIEVRTPTIEEGSVSMVHAFLDKGLGRGKSKSTLPLSVGRNQDHDGDSVIQAELNHNGFTFSDYKAGMQMDNESEKYFKDFEASTTMRATTINSQIHKANAKKLVEKENKMAIESTDIVNIMESAGVNAEGKIAPYSQIEMDSHKRNKYLKDYEFLQNRARLRLGDEFENAYESPKNMSKILHDEVGNLPEDQKEHYLRTIRKVEQYKNDMAVIQAKKAGKVSIGYINTPLFRTRMFIENEGFDEDKSRLINAVNYVFEESIISKKHADDSSISITGNIVEAYNNMINGKREGIETIHNLIDANKDEMVDYVRSHTDSFADNESSDNIISTIKSTYSDVAKIFSDDKNAKDRWLAGDIGKMINGSNSDALLSEANNESSNLAAKVLSSIKIEGTSEVAKPRAKDFKFDSSEYASSVKKGVSEMAESIEHMASSGGGKGLAVKALSLAAAVMATGYIGGNPTAPASNQAQEQSEDNQYDSLQDQDLNIQSIGQASGPQGYVVNINAQSERGKDHAVAAIQQALQRSTPTNINMQMNINDKSSNINSRYIQNLMAGAL